MDTLSACIASNFTALPIRTVLRHWAETFGLNVDLHMTTADQVFQNVLDPNSALRSHPERTAIVLLQIDRLRGRTADGADVDDDIDTLAGGFREMAQEQTILVGIVPSPGDARGGAANGAANGDMDAARPSTHEGSDRTGPDQAGARAVARFGSIPGVHAFQASDVASTYAVSTVFDATTDDVADLPFTRPYVAGLGTALFRTLRVLSDRPRKVLVLDCDDTLWDGVCAEDGATGVRIPPGRQALQRFALQKREEGMLVVLCSKNRESDVFAVFDRHPDMVMDRDDVVDWQINWQPKSASLRQLATDLDLSLDSFVFLDNNPVECAEVRTRCPEVATVQVPEDAADLPAFLRHCWIFDTVTVTAADRIRADFYQSKRERSTAYASAPSLEAFIDGLNLEVDIGAIAPETFSRVRQLTRRVNQFNLTSTACDASDLAAIADDDARGGCVVRVTDRFSAYGTVGAMTYRVDGDALEVTTFVLSCRALGRGVEHAMMARLGRLAREHGCTQVRIPFVATDRNVPARRFLDAVVPTPPDDAARTDDATCWYRLSASEAAQTTFDSAADAPTPPADAQTEPSTDASAPHGPTPDRDADAATGPAANVWERIATRYQTAEAIEAAVWGQNGARAASGPYVAPSSSVETTLAEIWAGVLGVQRVGRHDDFFELGGNSLDATVAISRISDALDVTLDLVAMLDAPTVAELARAVVDARFDEATRSPDQMDALEGLLDEVENMSSDEVDALMDE